MYSGLHTSGRAVLLIVLVGGSALLVPGTAGAQSTTAERAFLNRLDAAPHGTVEARC
jgi:hypothetical protein